MNQPTGYGTTAGLREAGSGSGSDRHGASEEQPLINGAGTNSQPRSLIGRVRKAAQAEVRRDWADVVLIFCYTITGLLDSASISIWGSFVSMQTGNTVYIGLGLSAPSESNRWIKSGTSLLSFCIGSLVFSRFHRFFSPKRRATLVASFACQALLCGLAAAIVSFGPGGYGPNDIRWDVLLPIALVAFQACGQAVTSRALKYNALTSVVLTSIYCDLFSDVDLLRMDNVERNRRVAAPAMLLLGALLGGLFAHSSFGVAGALWFAAALKALVVAVWLVWPGEEPDHEE